MVRELAGTRAALPAATMNHKPSPIDAVSLSPLSQHDLITVTGGGIGAQIGSLFGDKGAQWGGIADSIFGLFGGAFPGLGALTGGLGALTGGGTTSGSTTSGSTTGASTTGASPPGASMPGGFNIGGIANLFGSFASLIGKK
jgi:hypothetical protein